jgi:xeroderma pigmentosum group C-complementing protein
MRSCGRVIRAGCQPMKMVKVRAATVGRKREVEVAEEEMRWKSGATGGAGEGSSGIGVGGEEVMQGMYAEGQTELYIPEPIVDVCHFYLAFVCI